MDEDQLNRGWQRLASCLAQGQPLEPTVSMRHPFARGVWLLAGMVTVLLSIAPCRQWLGPSDRPLHWIVDGASVGTAETITAAASARVLFSDESYLRMKPSAKIRVLGTDARGAQVAIVDGVVDVFVKSRKDSSWRFEAGPFSIVANDATLRLSFEATSGRLGLRVIAGVADVRGPLQHRVFSLRRGESLELLASSPRDAPLAALSLCGLKKTKPPSENS